MSENERIRRRVRDLFESNEALYKAEYQNKTYSNILDDQINQKNEHVKDKIK